MTDRECGTVTITQEEYEDLLRSKMFLGCLIGCGVDNWDGYCDAIDMMEADE